MAKLKLDLHEIFNNGAEIEAELKRIIEEAVQKRIPLVQIIPGKGTGELKKHVQRFLAKPEVKKRYFKIENGNGNFGSIFVHFRHKNAGAYH